jgi:hypothetical protein
MGEQLVKTSDLTGEFLLQEDQIVKLRVIEHPALKGGPVVLDAQTSELKAVEKHQLEVAIFETAISGNVSRHVMLVTNFDALAKNGDMNHIVAEAASVKPVKAKTTNGERVNYATLEHCGELHRGKITEEEARLVRENQERASANREAQGHGAIDFSDPRERQRYGLR